MTARAGTTPGVRMASSSVACSAHTAEKGVAMASKVGYQSRRTVATTAGGLSNCWCSFTVRTLSGGATLVGASFQRVSPSRPPVLRARARHEVSG